jgi:hypothetical protein
MPRAVAKAVVVAVFTNMVLLRFSRREASFSALMPNLSPLPLKKVNERRQGADDSENSYM